jgi:hypothetical protein
VLVSRHSAEIRGPNRLDGRYAAHALSSRASPELTAVSLENVAELRTRHTDAGPAHLTGRAGWSAAGARSGSRSAWSWLAKAGNLDEAFGQLDAAIACREPALVHSPSLRRATRCARTSRARSWAEIYSFRR